jgi:SAM-dependent methyltransferase
MLIGPDGRLWTADALTLDAALSESGSGRPRRVVAPVAAEADAVGALVAQLRALAAAGVADEMVVVVAPAELDDAAALLEPALDGDSHLVVNLVAAADPAELLGPGAVLLRPIEGRQGTPTLVYAHAASAPDAAPADVPTTDKAAAELSFWRGILDAWERWYAGETLEGQIVPPAPEDKVTDYDKRTNAAVTFARMYQETKYVTDLALHPAALRGMRVLDVGCGPAASMLAFRGAELHGLDPLIDGYERAGFPLDVWRGMGFHYHCAPAESMPFPDGHFDAVVSVNAIDHVDDFAQTAREIQRILRPGGLFRMHVHYHSATVPEPIELNDEVLLQHYGWVPGLRRIAESDTKDAGLTRAGPGELYVLWGNT